MMLEVYVCQTSKLEQQLNNHMAFATLCHIYLGCLKAWMSIQQIQSHFLALVQPML